MERIPRQSGKEAADDIPGWARGKPRRVGETPTDYAERLLDEHYGKGAWSDKSPEFGQLKKWGSRAWRVPRPGLPLSEDSRPQA